MALFEKQSMGKQEAEELKQMHQLKLAKESTSKTVRETKSDWCEQEWTRH